MYYALYAFTLFVSASLLFSVQPMVGKMLLPILGGSPAVWNTSMVFFQGCLLAGYLYAHISTKWLGVRRQVFLHFGLMLAALLFLPLTITMPIDTSVLQSPARWLLIKLILAIGLPFFIISTSAPLLQKWFSQTNHADAKDPYHLYAASNVGSVLALVAYPFVIEPNLGLSTQSQVWAIIYILFILLVGGCAYFLWKDPSTGASFSVSSPAREVGRLPWPRRLKWIVWAFIPSSLMLSVTTFITTDIAPIPLLWVGPLMLYLITFILAYARRRVLKTQWALYLLPVFCVPLGLLLVVDVALPVWFITAFHFCTLFVAAMSFHGLLADDRPDTEHLTEYFLWISVGGALGGFFNALVAPVIFNTMVEYPIVILVIIVSIPAKVFGDTIFRMLLGIVVPFSLAWGLWGHYDLGEETLDLKVLFVFVLMSMSLLLAIILYWRSQWLKPILGVMILASIAGYTMKGEEDLHVERSFFAMHRVATSSYGEFHHYYHGNTSHGVQSRDFEFERMALSYYHLSGPLGQVFEELSLRPERHDIAVVGLGTGAIAAYAVHGQKIDFYEIDAAVERIARNEEYFTYLKHCGDKCNVILGDGRLQLAQAQDKSYELIVLDAYSSTAIPIHMLTREAMEIYLSKLTDDGIIAVHISNRHLDLEPPLTRMAEELDLAILVQDYYVEDPNLYNLYVDHSDWVILARQEQDFGALFGDDRWIWLVADPDVQVWTDDYANILQTYRW